MSLSTHTAISLSDQSFSEQLLALLSPELVEALSGIIRSLSGETLQGLQNLAGTDNLTEILETAATVVTEALATQSVNPIFPSFAIQNNLTAVGSLVSAYEAYRTDRTQVDRFLASQSPAFATFIVDAANTFNTAIAAYEVPNGAAAFTTVATNGDRLDNGNAGGATELKWTNTFTKADNSQATAVSFAFDDGFSLNGLTVKQAKTLFRRALQTWADYTPIDFQEVADPGSTSGVDILVQSKYLDGVGGTLAEAYFPSVGDITFDTSETWQNTQFLETAVHEIGHGLGLDHENDVPSIMGSTLTNQFTDPNSPFLQADDIAGIRHLYGVGQGSVRTIDNIVLPSNNALETTQLGPNLVTNGSFETISLKTNQFGLYSSVSGWSTLSGIGFRVDKRTESLGKPTDGEAWAALDIYNRNAAIGQNVDTLTGQRYVLSVDYSNGGQDQNTTGIDVFWDGKRVERLTSDIAGNWSTFTYDLIGGDRKASTLAFKAAGAGDSIGGWIDNISVRASLGASALTQLETSQLGTSSQQATTGLLESADAAANVVTGTQLASEFWAITPGFA